MAAAGSSAVRARGIGAFAVTLLLAACSSSSSGHPSGSGGATAGSGGATAGSGGIAGGSGGGTVGGKTASGGAVSTGGLAGSGNAAGATTASGGASSTGGSVGTGGGTASSGGASGVVVALDKPKQTMDGFGVSNFFQPRALSAAEADMLFDPMKGIGLSILRIAMNADGSVLAPSSGTTFNDVQLAKDRGVQTFIATILGAPATCKSNNDLFNGGHLLPQCQDSFAQTISKFVAAVKKNGSVDLAAISIANKPDFASCGMVKPCDGNFISMVYTADELVSFAKTVGPKLRAASPGIKLIAPEVMEWLHLWSNKSAAGSSDPLGGVGYDYGHALAADAEAWAQIDIVGTQQYDTQVAERWPTDVPAKPVWMTEMSGIKFWPEEGPSKTIDNGIAVAGWIHDAIVNGNASAWLYAGYRPPSTDDNEGLILKDGSDTKRHFTLGNFSKFVRPGYTRVDVTGNGNADVLLSAFKGADGTVVIVAINKGTAAVELPIAIGGGTAPATVSPWVTAATDNLTQKTTLTVTGSTFTATLGAQTVTTFVGK